MHSYKFIAKLFVGNTSYAIYYFTMRSNLTSALNTLDSIQKKAIFFVNLKKKLIDEVTVVINKYSYPKVELYSEKSKSRREYVVDQCDGFNCSNIETIVLKYRADSYTVDQDRRESDIITNFVFNVTLNNCSPKYNDIKLDFEKKECENNDLEFDLEKAPKSEFRDTDSENIDFDDINFIQDVNFSSKTKGQAKTTSVSVSSESKYSSSESEDTEDNESDTEDNESDTEDNGPESEDNGSETEGKQPDKPPASSEEKPVPKDLKTEGKQPDKPPGSSEKKPVPKVLKTEGKQPDKPPGSSEKKPVPKDLKTEGKQPDKPPGSSEKKPVPKDLKTEGKQPDKPPGSSEKKPVPKVLKTEGKQPDKPPGSSEKKPVPKDLKTEGKQPDKPPGSSEKKPVPKDLKTEGKQPDKPPSSSEEKPVPKDLKTEGKQHDKNPIQDLGKKPSTKTGFLLSNEPSIGSQVKSNPEYVEIVGENINVVKNLKVPLQFNLQSEETPKKLLTYSPKSSPFTSKSIYPVSGIPSPGTSYPSSTNTVSTFGNPTYSTDAPPTSYKIPMPSGQYIPYKTFSNSPLRYEDRYEDRYTNLSTLSGIRPATISSDDTHGMFPVKPTSGSLPSYRSTDEPYSGSTFSVPKFGTLPDYTSGKNPAIGESTFYSSPYYPSIAPGASSTSGISPASTGASRRLPGVPKFGTSPDYTSGISPGASRRLPDVPTFVSPYVLSGIRPATIPSDDTHGMFTVEPTFSYPPPSYRNTDEPYSGSTFSVPVGPSYPTSYPITSEQSPPSEVYGTPSQISPLSSEYISPAAGESTFDSSPYDPYIAPGASSTSGISPASTGASRRLPGVPKFGTSPDYTSGIRPATISSDDTHGMFPVKPTSGYLPPSYRNTDEPYSGSTFSVPVGPSYPTSYPITSEQSPPSEVYGTPSQISPLSSEYISPAIGESTFDSSPYDPYIAPGASSTSGISPASTGPGASRRLPDVSTFVSPDYTLGISPGASRRLPDVPTFVSPYVLSGIRPATIPSDDTHGMFPVKPTSGYPPPSYRSTDEPYSGSTFSVPVGPSYPTSYPITSEQSPPSEVYGTPSQISPLSSEYISPAIGESTFDSSPYDPYIAPGASSTSGISPASTGPGASRRLPGVSTFVSPYVLSGISPAAVKPTSGYPPPSYRSTDEPYSGSTFSVPVGPSYPTSYPITSEQSPPSEVYGTPSQISPLSSEYGKDIRPGSSEGILPGSSEGIRPGSSEDILPGSSAFPITPRSRYGESEFISSLPGSSIYDSSYISPATSVPNFGTSPDYTSGKNPAIGESNVDSPYDPSIAPGASSTSGISPASTGPGASTYNLSGISPATDALKFSGLRYIVINKQPTSLNLLNAKATSMSIRTSTNNVLNAVKRLISLIPSLSVNDIDNPPYNTQPLYPLCQLFLQYNTSLRFDNISLTYPYQLTGSSVADSLSDILNNSFDYVAHYPSI